VDLSVLPSTYSTFIGASIDSIFQL